MISIRSSCDLRCARHIVHAASTLSDLLADSPNVRSVYSFVRGRCRSEQAAASTPCDRAPASRHAAQLWCAHSPGGYSPMDGRWNNSDAQQLEMLLGGNSSWPQPACVARGQPLSSHPTPQPASSSNHML